MIHDIPTFQDNSKIVAIFGAGRTGLALAKSLNKLGFQVDLYDLVDTNVLKTDIDQSHKDFYFTILSKNLIEARHQIQARTRANKSLYYSIFHTFLYTANDFEIFITLTQGFSQHFGTIGTVLSFDRLIDRGPLSENSPKLTPENLYQNGGYAAGKRGLEIAIEKYQMAHPDKSFFLAKTCHILGNSWIPGICFPYFRDYTLLLHLKQEQIFLPKGGQILHQVIDSFDLANLIALGISKQLDGDYILLNPKVISVKQYYELLAKIYDPFLNLKINDMPLELVTDSKMMLYDWVCDSGKILTAIDQDYTFISHEQTVSKTVAFLQKELAKNPALITQKSDIFEKMNVKPYPILPSSNGQIDPSKLEIATAQMSFFYQNYSYMAEVYRQLEVNKISIPSDAFDHQDYTTTFSSLAALYAHAYTTHNSPSALKMIQFLDKSQSSKNPDYVRTLDILRDQIEHIYHFNEQVVQDKMFPKIEARRLSGTVAILTENPDIIVDLGCGVGSFLHDLLELKLDKKIWILGIDVEQNIKIAKLFASEIFPAHIANLSFWAADLLEFETIQTIFSTFVTAIAETQNQIFPPKLAFYNQGLFRYLAKATQIEFAKIIYQLALIYPGEVIWIQTDNEILDKEINVSRLNGTSLNIFTSKDDMCNTFATAGWQVDREYFDNQHILILRK